MGNLQRQIQQSAKPQRIPLPARYIEDFTRVNVIKEVYEWVHTPFHHQARIKYAGCDCIGLVIGIARVFKYDKKVGFVEYNKYERMPDTDLMTKLLDTYLDRIPIKEAQPGDILHLYFIQRPQHVGFLMPNNKIVHAYEERKEVAHHEIDKWWWSRVVNAYKFRGIK